ncbi:MAG: hypothetical protein JXR70_03045 [Spirochaetales bacterium]|nr:hypothetical protein [Spirochaetales bacterium]
MKKWILALFVIAFGLSCSNTASKVPLVLENQKNNIKINIDMSISDIIAFLGEPQSKEAFTADPNILRYAFEGFSVINRENLDDLLFIECTDPDYSLGGIKIGDNKNEVYKIFPKNFVTDNASFDRTAQQTVLSMFIPFKDPMGKNFFVGITDPKNNRKHFYGLRFYYNENDIIEKIELGYSMINIGGIS